MNSCTISPLHLDRYSTEMGSDLGGLSWTGVFGSNLPFLGSDECASDIMGDMVWGLRNEKVRVVMFFVII